ncbi:hypothetical protein [Acinetobacter haemolyticus]|uniref:hypothetical protein n=1 Tax=Acinetobacter haemolyticus TaxID=29430 RepID=UPI003008BD31
MDIENETTELAISSHAQKIGVLATQLGYDGSLTVGALEDEIRFYQRRTVEACLELGKRLVLLKEITPHGEFKQRIEMLNINLRAAQRFMSAALKFTKNDNLSLLNAAGNQSKLLELLVLDDEDIAELSNGGSVHDITLDDIDRMTATELRKKLREANANIEAKEQVIKTKDQRANELLEENTKLKSPAQIKKRAETEQQQLAKKALEEISAACLKMHNDTVRFTNEINSVIDAIEEHGLYDIQEQLEADVVAAFQQIAQTSVALGIQIDFEAMVSPSWMTDDINKDELGIEELQQLQQGVETLLES